MVYMPGGVLTRHPHRRPASYYSAYPSTDLRESLFCRRQVPCMPLVCRWVHCYTAGVDALSGFIAGPLKEVGLPLTNGRGAFSSSLAEFAMLAALHFNKKVPRLQANRASRTWDKFEMPVLRGKTMGLLGYGDIAKHTARLAKSFGMSVIALRRNADKVSAGVPAEF